MSRTKNILSLCISLLLAGTTIPATAAEFVVKSGMPFVIVQPDKPLPVEKTAATELAAYIGKTTGASPQIIAESDSNSRNGNAYIGQCAFTRSQAFYRKELKSEEFQVAIADGRLFIYGDDQNGKPFAANVCTGTLFGVYDFIEKELGVAWLWPGELGEDIPALREIKLKDFSRLDHPGFMIRSMMFGYSKYEPEKVNEEISIWAKRMKLSWVK